MFGRPLLSVGGRWCGVVGRVEGGMRWRHSGSASAEATEAYCQKRKMVIHKPKATGWSLSGAGIGTFRVNLNETETRHAVSDALLSVCNVVDTSASFQSGQGEELVGDLLNELIEEEKKLTRSELVILGKGGCFQGDDLSHLKYKLEDPSNDTVGYPCRPDMWYSMSPENLKYQLDNTLKKLGLETLDVYFLNYPEYSLQHFASSVPSQGDVNPLEKMEEQLLEAFTYLESEVKNGRIQYYGIVSNAFHLPPSHPHHLSIFSLLQIAQKANPEGHHFAALQCIFNWFEPENAVSCTQSLPNSSELVTPLEFAEKEGLMVFTHRTFNAIQTLPDGETQYTRLVESPDWAHMDLPGLMKEAFDYAIHWERTYPGLPDKATPQDERHLLPPPADVFWGQAIAANTQHLRPLWKWRDIHARQIQPTLSAALGKMERNKTGLWWAHKYRTLVKNLFERYTWSLEQANMREVNKFKNKIKTQNPSSYLVQSKDGETGLNMTHMSLRLPLFFGCCGIIGMRTVQQVQTTKDIVQEAELVWDKLEKEGQEKKQNQEEIKEMLRHLNPPPKQYQ